MSAQDGIKLAQTFVDAFDSGEVDRIDEILTDDFVEHDPFPGLPPTRAGVLETAKVFKAAFPDIRSEIIETVATDDKVTVVLETTGTHQGEFLGVDPTGKKFKVREIHVGRVRDGKLAEHWGVVDAAAMMQQLGLAPAPGS